MPKFTFIKGNTFRDNKGRFVSSRQVLERTGQAEDISYREWLYYQRTLSARESAQVRGEYEHVTPKFNAQTDAFLSRFSDTPRAERTSKEWARFRQAMIDIYGEDQDDWGDYY